ncbi:MAG: NAD+ synthase, partial [Calditrichia bacterium]|nr:NAD+ synthase [Calditrichia bacterium]
ISRYVEEDWPVEEIIEGGIDRNIVEKVVSMINTNEYKRRQSAPGIKITPRSFGKDRRMPITNRYKEKQ